MSDTQGASEPTVVARRQGRIGRITLNRPRALNALDVPMIDAVTAALDAWREDPAVHAVVLEGAGDRAFCVGGDIRQVRAASMAGDTAFLERFFSTEYALNLAISRYEKPYVSVIDGFCMGGGIGLSVHGSVRVASERAQFAMPETAIGLFPDVGATYALPRLRGDWGMYLALTGARVGGADAVWLGLATHFVPHEALAGLADAMAEDGIAALGAAVRTAPESALAGHDAGAFGLESVGAIVARLEAAEDAFSREALAALRQVSPSSVLWTFEIVRAGAGRTLEQALAAELRLTRTATRHPDFLEGVRAMVVDKDRSPTWAPGRIEDVDAAATRAMFTND